MASSIDRANRVNTILEPAVSGLARREIKNRSFQNMNRPAVYWEPWPNGSSTVSRAWENTPKASWELLISKISTKISGSSGLPYTRLHTFLTPYDT